MAMYNYDSEYDDEDEVRSAPRSRRDTDDGVYRESSRSRSGMGCMAVIAAVVLVMMVNVGIIGAAFWYISQIPGDRNDRTPRELSSELREVMFDGQSLTDEEKDVARYFHYICKGTSLGFRQEFDQKNSLYKTRQQVVDNIGYVAHFSVAVKGANEFERLPEFFEEKIGGVLEKEDGEIMDGDLTSKEQDSLVDLWDELSQAFLELSGG